MHAWRLLTALWSRCCWYVIRCGLWNRTPVVCVLAKTHRGPWTGAAAICVCVPHVPPVPWVTVSVLDHMTGNRWYSGVAPHPQHTPWEHAAPAMSSNTQSGHDCSHRQVVDKDCSKMAHIHLQLPVKSLKMQLQGPPFSCSSLFSHILPAGLHRKTCPRLAASICIPTEHAHTHTSKRRSLCRVCDTCVNKKQKWLPQPPLTLQPAG